MTKTATEQINELVTVINDRTAPKWKRDSARKKLMKAKNKYDRIRKAIEESEEFPYDTIWGIYKE